MCRPNQIQLLTVTLYSLLLIPCASFAAERTASIDCASVTATPASVKTERTTNGKKSSDAYASLEMSRDASDPSGKTCVATYTLYMSQYSQNFRPVKTYSTTVRDVAGISLIGFSDDDSKLAADFWWQTGDYRGHRPVVFDLKSKIARIGELNDQITSQLPACAYTEEVVGINNAGLALVHVPAGKRENADCPDQGNWLYDLRSDSATRAAAPK